MQHGMQQGTRQGTTLGHLISLENVRRQVADLWKRTWRFSVLIYNEMDRTRAYTVAAGLAFYFLWSLVPLLILLSSLLKFLPIPNLFEQMLKLMAELVPSSAMSFVEQIVIGILSPSRTKLLSFGIIGYCWAASGGFSSLIEALDIAYDVRVSRPWWKDRLRALVLTVTSGALASVSLLVFILGPHLGHFLHHMFLLPQGVEHMGPVVRLAINFVTFVAGLEIIYYLGPNARHSFMSTIPGAVLAIAVWFVGSWGLSFYLSHMSNYDATYGSMGALIGLMLWIYLTALAILLGAELNAERAKAKAVGSTQRRPLIFPVPAGGTHDSVVGGKV
ncbi:MAG TPA: YihY/virulence factor BrkB family protein [Silvibacterium sp.]|nr:YihY/virulence factor BrkB family protein [Silvibacterium sp.]